jgi:hypothetical protein
MAHTPWNKSAGDPSGTDPSLRGLKGFEAITPPSKYYKYFKKYNITLKGR